MALKVIGAGLGRTGTMSLKLALEQLGFGPCFHMAEFFTSPKGEALKATWERVAYDPAPPDWDLVVRFRHLSPVAESAEQMSESEDH